MPSKNAEILKEHLHKMLITVPYMNGEYIRKEDCDRIVDEFFEMQEIDLTNKTEE